ncbi:MAG: sigma-54-dependent Fis family transcriptional regulator [Chlorobi bacterium]|nr:sigma-54-dependent Fis family transcriptional regulator [Chlorobiota bacterium]
MKLLVIDDDISIVETLQLFFSEHGFEVIGIHTVEEARRSAKTLVPDVVICDISLPDGNGLDLIQEWKDSGFKAPVIMLTAHEDMGTTVRAVQQGAFDYVTKPVELSNLMDIVKRAIEYMNVKDAVTFSQVAGSLHEYNLEYTLIGSHPSIQEVFKQIGIASQSNVTVLIQGETGTGKEVVARAIHAFGSKQDEPFHAINCSAIPEALLESELFGHVKGAFTDAIRDKQGKFELAGEGTVFLDEIGDMPFGMQSKLLRVLQQKEFEKVGGNETVPLKARIIAATHRDIKSEVERGLFREDLYYRLNILTITVPPLRERKDDIPQLVEHLLKKINASLHKNIKTVPRKMLRIFHNYDWPGNIRELENVLTRSVALATNEILPIVPLNQESIRSENGSVSFSVDKAGNPFSLRELEKRHILFVLDYCDGDKTKACEILGITKPTLYSKLKSYGFAIGKKD